MKQFYTYIFAIMSCMTFAQNGYELALIHNGGYSFSVTATPNFDATDTDISDVGFALMLPTGDADVTSLSQFNGRAWSATQVTAAQLTGLGLGDGTRDAFAMNLPPGQTIQSHTAGEQIVLITFEVSNTPTSGLIEILANTDAIAIGLGGAVDSFYNSNIDSTTTQDYFSGLVSGFASFMFDTLSIDGVITNAFEVKVYPNPTLDVVFLDTPQKINSVEVFNLLGKRVLTTTDKNISLKHLNSGVYLMQIATERGRITKRIIKK
jgi:hypothetical protein